MMNGNMMRLLVCACLILGIGICSQAQPNPQEQVQPKQQEEVWLYGSFQEINSASPVIGGATLPLSLGKAIVSAVPAQYLKESADAGFDIPTIANIIESMPAGETFELTKNDFNLVIMKKKVPIDPEASASSLVIQNEQLRLPIPLILTGTVVKALQLAFKELRGLDEPLANVINEVKQTPPGTLLKGEDRLMKSWLEIRLQ